MQHTSFLTAPSIQLPNSFMQYPSVATQPSSKPPSSTRLSIQINIQQPRAVLQQLSSISSTKAPSFDRSNQLQKSTLYNLDTVCYRLRRSATSKSRQSRALRPSYSSVSIRGSCQRAPPHLTTISALPDSQSSASTLFLHS